MYKILLCCKSGLTTNMLVSAMKEEAKKQDINAIIWAVAESAIPLSWADADCVLIAPQSAGDVNRVKDVINDSIPVAVIDQNDFVEMNGQAVFNQAIALLNG